MFEHSCARFACGLILMVKRTVYENFIKSNPLTFEDAEHLIVRGPECVFRKGIRTEAVLIGDHNKQVIRLLPDSFQIAYNAGDEFQFFE